MKLIFWGRAGSESSSLAGTIVFSFGREVVRFVEGMQSAQFNIFGAPALLLAQRVSRSSTPGPRTRATCGPKFRASGYAVATEKNQRSRIRERKRLGNRTHLQS